ncbi:MAG: UDP-N-acetylmuramoyl-L-alanyl-D-glutamate--2,6-diaminopimelate ligase [Rhodoferax sp.]|nr:UDP-N-acetylmuramoyl-L-alanyl-D-glutamate--2,6-diaminopimelate ligase [Rhodoferax sp.]
MQELHAPAAAAAWLRGHVTGTLRSDSRTVAPGDGFLAWPGAAHDARAHVGAALAQGAAACLVERDGADRFALPDDPRVAGYTGLRTASALVACAFFDDPSHALRVIAVTGTNGKTSTAWWLALALSSSRIDPPLPCAMVGTLGIGQPPAADAGASDPAPLAATGLTTPDPVLLQASLRRFVDAGLRACALEASSIGIDEHRLDGTRVHTAVFTNFTQDHLDYHGSMQAYWQAKTRLFQWPGLAAAVINIDDAKGQALTQLPAVQTLDLWTISCHAPARLQAQSIGVGETGLEFDVVEGTQREHLRTRLIGQYNVNNLLGVIAAMRSLGVPLAQAVGACAELMPVPGRMQRLLEAGQPLVAIDYAHTPDALDKALEALRPVARQRQGRLWCVFGCGGDRDPGKRPLMGTAARSADHVLVTSDNPRSEDPQAIIGQILPALAGHASLHQQADRALAIASAIMSAADADVILVAGKGHEDYQEVAGQKRPFSDLAQARAALARRRSAAQGVAA